MAVAHDPHAARFALAALVMPASSTNNAEETTMNGASKQRGTSSTLYPNGQLTKSGKPLSVVEPGVGATSSRSGKRLSIFESQATLESEAGIPSSRYGNQASIPESKPTTTTYEEGTNQEGDQGGGHTKAANGILIATP